MEQWKSHVRAGLFQRDSAQREPFSGLFNALAQLEERFEIHETFWDEVRPASCEADGGLTVGPPRELHLRLRESEHMREKLSQTVSDLTAVFYLKDAEVQYCHSQITRYRKEAVSLARDLGATRANLSDCEFTVESQSKELAALRLEQRELREGLAEAWREKEELLERWMEEKKEEAERVNGHNDAQERWRRFTRRLNRHLNRRLHRDVQPAGLTSSGRQNLQPGKGALRSSPEVEFSCDSLGTNDTKGKQKT